MSKNDAVLLASRTLAVLFMVWALAEVSYLPALAYSLKHYLNIESASAYTEHMRHYELMQVGFLVTRIVGFSLFSTLLFKCGPDIQQLLLPVDEP